MAKSAVVHGIREGNIVWSRPEIVVMITLGKEKLMYRVIGLVLHASTSWLLDTDRLIYRRQPAAVSI